MSIWNNERYSSDLVCIFQFPRIKHQFTTFFFHSVHSFGALPENNQENNGVFSLPHYLSVCNFIVFILLNYGKKHWVWERSLFCLLQYTQNGLNKTAFVRLSECFVCSLFSVVYSLPSSHKSVYDIFTSNFCNVGN